MVAFVYNINPYDRDMAEMRWTTILHQASVNPNNFHTAVQALKKLTIIVPYASIGPQLKPMRLRHGTNGIDYLLT